MSLSTIAAITDRSDLDEIQLPQSLFPIHQNVSVLVCARVHSALGAYVKTTADQRRVVGAACLVLLCRS